MEVNQNEDKKKWSAVTLNERLTLLITCLGLFVQIFGFIFVVKSLNATERGLNSADRAVSTNNYLQTYGWALEIDKLLVDQPELRPYFINTKPLYVEPCFADTGKVAATAEYMLDVFDAVLNNTSYFKTDSITKRQWQTTIRNYFKQSPILKERFKNERNLYGEDLNKVFNNAN